MSARLAFYFERIIHVFVIVPGMGKEIQGWTREEEGEFPFAEPEGVWRRRRSAAPCGIPQWRNLPQESTLTKIEESSR
jgi:hypothetical protein